MSQRALDFGEALPEHLAPDHAELARIGRAVFVERYGEAFTREVEAKLADALPCPYCEGSGRDLDTGEACIAFAECRALNAEQRP